MKHDYTNETELKSFLIREKNRKLNLKPCSITLNHEINNLINRFKNGEKNLKDSIIEKSFETAIDDYSHEVFGSIVILMIRKILTKPNFSGYTWTEDFISDSCYRVFKYLHNFEPSKISKISGQSVNAFAYVSQIIHNSIVAIIKQKQKEQKDIDSFVAETEANTGPFVGDLKYDNPEINPKIIKIETESDFFDIDLNSVENKHIILEYSNFKISYDLYARIYAYLKKYADKNISIVKSKSKTK